MKNIKEYIKECLDVDNFSYKFDVWFKTDKENYKPMLDFMIDCKDRKIVTKEDVEAFLSKHSNFKVKKFVDFFDEDVKRDEAINVDYIYLFTKIIENFITNFNLLHKIEYCKQAFLNGTPNTEIDTNSIPLANEDDKDKKEKNQ